MTHKRAKAIQAKFIKKAKSHGVEIYKNNVESAKPLHIICKGFISTKYPTSLENLVEGR